MDITNTELCVAAFSVIYPMMHLQDQWKRCDSNLSCLQITKLDTVQTIFFVIQYIMYRGAQVHAKLHRNNGLRLV